MESLQDMLLEHVVPDQKGELGKISYAFSEFGYTKNGEFIFDLSGICLSIKENKPGVPESPAHDYDDYSHHEKYLNHGRNELREVACTVAHVKVKFHGGAAMICQFLTSLYIKMYKRQLEIQVSLYGVTQKGNSKIQVQVVTPATDQFCTEHFEKLRSTNHIASVIQETLKDDQQVLYSALTVMAAMHGESPDTLTASLPRRHRTLTHHTDTEQSPSRVQRFFSSFRRSHSTYS